jgi:glycosyltransferase involved in cell wall biosynthesis
MDILNMANKLSKVSVIIIQGGNFDRGLYEKCLDSVSFADEIIKVETDKLKGNFSDFRNLGAKKAKNEWLLYIDTDEIVTPELQKVILSATASDEFSAYAIPRRNIVLGREMKHCGLWPDYVLRLIKKDKLVGWEGELHEQPKVTGKISHLKEPLIHKKHDNLSEMVDKTNRWSEVEAKLMFEAHHPPMNFFRFVSAGIREFWLRMIVQSAFMDGVEGTIYGLYQVFSRLISYSKLWEMQIKRESSNS